MPTADEEEIATCPNCGTEYPERDAETEPVYECTECGAEGFDCCVPGNNSLCTDCEDANVDVPDEEGE